jgi:hypothetical protein
MLLSSLLAARAQSLDEMNLQFHGYVTQGFVYSTNNNWNTTDSTSGSPAWSEAVVSITSQPSPKLRVGAQARYYLLGQYGNQITLDWASADYTVNNKFAVRAGKVKSPTGLLNEIQDVDPAFIWSLLPGSIYPIASRTSVLAHYGAVGYGTLSPSKDFGKLEYRIWGGERVMPADDGFFAPMRASGVVFPNGLNGPAMGAELNWKPRIDGLMLGAALDREDPTGAVTISAAGLSGNNLSSPFVIPHYYGQYEHNKVMLAGEYSRVIAIHKTQLTGVPLSTSRIDQGQFYVMSSYKLTQKLTPGAYYSYYLDKQAAMNSSRYEKDWVISARYDFNSTLYLKAEEHFTQGTAYGFLSTDNTNLQPNSKLTVLKFGASF